MRTIERSSAGVPLDVALSRPARPAATASDDVPFGAFIGAFLGILLSAPFWIVLAVVIALLRRG